MREQLLALEEEGTPIRVAVIGCGRFGSMVVSQLGRAPGMQASIACDLDIQRASSTIAHERRPRIRPVKANDVGQANDALNKGTPVATDDSSVARAKVELVAYRDIAAKHATRHYGRKHIVWFRSGDVLVGPPLPTVWECIPQATEISLRS